MWEETEGPSVFNTRMPRKRAELSTRYLPGYHLHGRKIHEDAISPIITEDT